jgi:hypothetical protein
MISIDTKEEKSHERQWDTLDAQTASKAIETYELEGPSTLSINDLIAQIEAK